MCAVETMNTNRTRDPDVDVLVVGAGPTGLTLASQLVRFDVRFRIIDKAQDRAGESRALGVQARSLEVLQALGLGEALASRGRTTTRLLLHVDRGEPPAIELGNVDRDDTRFPFILFVSQSETEAVLGPHLVSCGIVTDAGVELESMRQQAEGIACTLCHADGRHEVIRASYVAGCDGAHSSVRKLARPRVHPTAKRPRPSRRSSTRRSARDYCRSFAAAISIFSTRMLSPVSVPVSVTICPACARTSTSWVRQFVNFSV